MKRSGKGAWPVVLSLIIILLAGGIYLFSRAVWADTGVAVTPYACGNGVNVIIVSDPYKANNFRSITSAVKKAISKGGSNSTVIFVTGVFDTEKGSHIEDLFESLSKLGAAEVYAYPTNIENFSSNHAINIHGQTDTVEINSKGTSSAAVEVQRKAHLLSTSKTASENAVASLQVWDIECFERRDVELSDASVKILIGGVDKERIACDIYIYTGDTEGKEAGVTNALSGIEGGDKAAFNYETSAARVLVYCGTSGSQSTDKFFTRHSIGAVEIANVGE